MLLKKMSLFAACFALLIGLGFISFNNPQAETINVLPDYSSCVKISAGSSGGSQQSMRFYNSCPTRLYFKACVKDTTGQLKLFTSPNYVSTNGNWTIYTFPGVTPSQVAWAAAPYSPPTPELCNKP